MQFETALTLPTGIASDDPLRIYTGILGQIGDIIMFTATARRLKELFPRSTLTFAVSARYREAGQLVEGLPYVDRLFVTQLYFERLPGPAYGPWHLGWPVDLRGDDEVAEQRRHDVVFETRPRHRRLRWWEHAHQVEECAHQIGVPGPIDRTTEMGTRTGRSTRAFLYAQPEVLICYDLERQPEVDLLEQAARNAGRPRFRFCQADVLDVEIEETDLLFIDTLHVYEQTRAELARHARKARRYLLFHDTTTFGETGETPGSHGIWLAIEEFLHAHPEWQLLARHTHNNGLTILQRSPVLSRPAEPIRSLPSAPVDPAPDAPAAEPAPTTGRLAILIPVHNALDYVQQVCTSIIRTCPGTPLIIVDDHCDAETAQWLRQFLGQAWPGSQEWPRVLLRNERQQLFTRTANRALRWAHHWRRTTGGPAIDFVAVVNTDCELQENWLKALHLGMDDPRVGIVGFSDHADGEEPLFREMREPDFIAGHCILLRMAMLEQIGIFSETDTDGRDSPGLAALKGQAHVGSDRGLSWRANRAGWRTLYCHSPLCFHPGGGSWHNDLAWLSSFDLQPLLPPCDQLDHPSCPSTCES